MANGLILSGYHTVTVVQNQKQLVNGEVKA